MIRERPWVGRALALLGVAVLIVELVGHWFVGRAIQPWPVIIGAGFGWLGFYLQDPKGAINAGTFIEGFTVRVIGTIRSGRRSTDTRVVDPDVKIDARPELTDDDKGVG